MGLVGVVGVFQAGEQAVRRLRGRSERGQGGVLGQPVLGMGRNEDLPLENSREV